MIGVDLLDCGRGFTSADTPLIFNCMTSEEFLMTAESLTP